jgi:hypothetical protein
MELVIMEDNPFTIVESETYKRAVRYSPMTRPTLMKYIENTHNYLIEVLGASIPNRFGVIFDGNSIQYSPNSLVCRMDMRWNEGTLLWLFFDLVHEK